MNNYPKRNRTLQVKKISEHNLLIDDMIIGLSGMQGIRKTMEDLHFKKVIRVYRKGIRTVTLVGVFDGHGGLETVVFLQNNLYPMIIEVIEKQIEEITYPRNRILERDEDVVRIFQECDYKCCDQLYKEGFEDNSGSTCIGTIIVVYDDGLIEVVTCNVGDSRCILYDRGEVLQLSYDHKPGDSEESVRVERNGGFISKGRIYRKDMEKFTLGVSRTFGDFSFKPKTVSHIRMGLNQIDPMKAKEELDNQLVIVKPRVTRYQMRVSEVGGINPYRFVVLACDGVFDKMNSDRCCDFVLKRLKEQEDGSYFEKRVERLTRIYRSSRLPLDLITRKKRNGKLDDQTSQSIRGNNGKKTLNQLEKYDMTSIAEELLDHCVLVEKSTDNCSATIVLFKGEDDWI